jgi:hypothetical protein
MEKYLEKFKELHGLRFDYSLIRDISNLKSIIRIICDKHGEFETNSKDHLRTKSGGCKKCAGIKSVDYFKELSFNVHGDKYDYSLITNIKNNRDKLNIICNKHDEQFIFKQTSYKHIHRKQGCPLCVGKYSYDYQEFIRKSEKIHQNKYEYSYLKEDYKDNKTKVRIICKDHGIFLQTPNSHLRGDGCNRCVRRDLSSVESYIKEANKIHKNKYDYSLVKEVKGDIEIICPIHGKYIQNIQNHIYGSGCRKCGGCEPYDQDSVIEKFKSVHRDRFDYSLVEFESINTKVDIICKNHGVFKQTPFMHYSGQGCPFCKSSKGEIRIKNYLDDNSLEYVFQKKFDDLIHMGKLSFDFYLPQYNMCVEYDGLQHFESVEYFGGDDNFKNTQIRDQLKNEYCLNNNIYLLRISYLDYDNIEKILEDNIPKVYSGNYRIPNSKDNFDNIINFFGNKPFKVKIERRTNCLENRCHSNVNNYVSMYGGERVNGYYLIFDIDNNKFLCIRHSIWKNTYGDLIDITPFKDDRKWNLFIESELTKTSIEI